MDVVGKAFSTLFARSPCSSAKLSSGGAILRRKTVLDAIGPVLGSLEVTVIEAAGLAASNISDTSDLYCVVSVGEIQKRTEVQRGAPHPLWQSEFVFDVTDSTETILVLEVFYTDRFRSPSFFGHSFLTQVISDSLIGHVRIALSSLIHENIVDEWFKLSPSEKNQAKGSVHLCLRYTNSDTAESALKQKFCDVSATLKTESPHFNASFCICQTLVPRADLARAFVRLFDSQGFLVDFVRIVVRAEVNRTPSISMLFRTNSWATKILKCYVDLAGKPYLVSTLSSIIMDNFLGDIEYEIDPDRSLATADLMSNINTLQLLVEQFWNEIKANTHLLPTTYRCLLAVINEEVLARFPESVLFDEPDSEPPTYNSNSCRGTSTEADTDITNRSATDITTRSATDITTRSATDITTRSATDITTRSSTDITAESVTDITIRSVADISAQSSCCLHNLSPLIVSPNSRSDPVHIPVSGSPLSESSGNEQVNQLSLRISPSVSGFFFLRFVIPALVAPTQHGIIDGMPSKKGRRGLQLTAKILESFSSNVNFGRKEVYMTSMNYFVREHIGEVCTFFQDLLEKSPKSSGKSINRLQYRATDLIIFDKAMRGDLQGQIHSPAPLGSPSCFRLQPSPATKHESLEMNSISLCGPP